MIRVLKKYAFLPNIITLSQGMAIQAMTGKSRPECGEIAKFDLEEI